MQPVRYPKFRKRLPELTEAEFKEIVNKPIQDAKNGVTRVYFVRHGTSEGKELNLAGGGLDLHGLIDKGRDESRALGERFSSSKVDAVFCADTKRTVDTAEIVAKTLGLKSESDSRLNQKHWGFWHGKPINAEYKKSRVEGEKKIDALPTFYEKMDFKFDEGETKEETLIEVLDRTFAFLKDQKPGKTIIAVTHTPVLKAINSALIAQKLGKELVYHRHDFANGGMIVVDVNENGTFELAGVEKMTFRGAVKYSV